MRMGVDRGGPEPVLVAPPTAQALVKPPRTSPATLRAGDRVRHVTTGDAGTWEGPAGDAWLQWALVRWDDEGPGMRDKQGLARVAPRLLERCDGVAPTAASRRAGGLS